MIEDAQLQQALVIWIPYTLTYEADMGLFRDYEGWYLTLMTPIHTKKNQNGIYQTYEFEVIIRNYSLNGDIPFELEWRQWIKKEGIFIKMNKNYATFSKFIGCLKDSCMHRKSKYYTQVKDENLKHNIDEYIKTA